MGDDGSLGAEAKSAKGEHAEFLGYTNG